MLCYSLRCSVIIKAGKVVLTHKRTTLAHSHSTLGSASGTYTVGHISLKLPVLRGNKVPSFPTQLQSPLGYPALRGPGGEELDKIRGLKGRAQGQLSKWK